MSGYEIRHGRVYRRGGEAVFVGDGTEEGCLVGAVIGVSWHGVMEADDFRRNFLRWVAGERGLDWEPGNESFAAARERRLEKLGDVVAENIDREALLRLVENGAPEKLPIIASRLVSRSAGQQATSAVGSRPEASSFKVGEGLASIPFAAPGSDEQRGKT